MDFIKNLVDNYQIPKEPVEIDLVLEGGACNIGYLLGSLLLIKELEKKEYFKVGRISGCSAGAIMAFYYKTDNLDSWITDYIIIKKHFKNNLNLSALKDLLEKMGEKISDEVFKKIKKNKLYINYQDENYNQIIKKEYEKKEDIIDAILKSSHLPYLMDEKKYNNKCMDGGFPYIFTERGGTDKKMIYLSIANKYFLTGLLKVKNEINVYGRVIEGALEMHKFILYNKNSYMASYVNDWGFLDYLGLRLNECCFYTFIYLLFLLDYLLNEIYPKTKHIFLIKKIHDLIKKSMEDIMMSYCI
jgi:hypothetical protein